jgi:hypothetical protein
LGHPVPVAGLGRPSEDRPAYWHTARPQRGYHVPHQLRRGGGGCFLYCVAWVPQHAEVACVDQTEDAVWFLASSSSRQPSLATSFRNAASTEVHWHSPVPSFPYLVHLDGSGSPWASPVCSRTPRYRGTCAGQEPTWALVGAVVTRHRPLIWSDFVSHALHVILAAFGEIIGSGIRLAGARKNSRAARLRDQGTPDIPASASSRLRQWPPSP